MTPYQSRTRPFCPRCGARMLREWDLDADLAPHGSAWLWRCVACGGERLPDGDGAPPAATRPGRHMARTRARVTR